MNRPTSHLQCNGEKIRQHRLGMRLTQEKLAAMSNTTVRTIQRAESGAPLQMETVASIAAALNLTVADIVERPVLDEDGNELGDFNAVVLRPLSSGKILMDSVCDSFSAKLTCKAEPTAENIEVLSAFVEMLEDMLPNPWRSPMDDEPISLANRLRKSVAISEQISSLNAVGVAVYAGTYTASAQVPRYDVDEGCMYTSSGQRFEPVTACHVLIDRAGLERVIEHVTDKWEPPVSRHPEKPLEADDEIPF